MRKIFEPVTKSIRDASEEVTETMMETSIKNNEAQVNWNDKLLEVMNDSVTIASCLLSPLSKITNLENTSQHKLVKILIQTESMIC